MLSLRSLPVCRFVVYLSTVCEDAVQGKKLINAAINALFTIPSSENHEEHCTEHEREFTVEKVKPTLLWSILYIQELTMVGLCPCCSHFVVFSLFLLIKFSPEADLLVFCAFVSPLISN